MLEKSPRLKCVQIVAVAFLMLAGIVNYLDRSTLSIANHSVTQGLAFPLRRWACCCPHSRSRMRFRSCPSA